ncbi:hypothetical protein MMRN_58180 [Mycobacterium marinum]|nr:hypothetical protein MMRN_58180 [Mycobacterium marinum]
MSRCRAVSANDVLARYVPVLNDLRMRYLDDEDRTGDLVVVSHGAAIRLAGAVLAGVDANFALDNHLDNAESVVLTPITDGRWSCVRWGTKTPPFCAEVDSAAGDLMASSGDPMG